MEQLFFTWVSSMDTLDEIEACGRGLYAYYLEYLRRFVAGNFELTPVEHGTPGSQLLSFFDWMF
eukprot:4708986-Pyramimonas_sp.AAC.1